MANKFAALSDPTRLAIVQRLAIGEATVTELAEPFDMSQPAVSRHLKVLESAGLISRRIDGQRRPCRLADGALDNLDQWLSMLRRSMAANYDRLDAVLAEMQAEDERTTE
ncbi:ArsR family transcriptional regulator [Loktanella sp. S4079]|nr:ArsR family transcriptional regulator [Loktanella sp. S4079]